MTTKKKKAKKVKIIPELNASAVALIRIRKELSELKKQETVLKNSFLDVIKTRKIDIIDTGVFEIERVDKAVTSISPGDFFRKVTIQEFIDSCKIGVAKARKILGEDEIDKISTNKIVKEIVIRKAASKIEDVNEALVMEAG